MTEIKESKQGINPIPTVPSKIDTTHATPEQKQNSAVLHSLNVALTQINHHYPAGQELIPFQLLIPMEEARPGTVKEYAQVLLDEPRHRHSLDKHESIRAYIALIANYLFAFFLVGATVFLAYSNQLGGAVATAVVSIGQIAVAAFGSRATVDSENRSIPETKNQQPKKKQK